jgi:hypothetical protein
MAASTMVGTVLLPVQLRIYSAAQAIPFPRSPAHSLLAAHANEGGRWQEHSHSPDVPCDSG